MTATYRGAVDRIVEALEYVQPDTLAQASETADEALHEYIDSALIYTLDILRLWDGSTHEAVVLSDYVDIMSTVIASTYFQLREDWAGAIDDGIHEYADLTGADLMP